MGLHHRFSTLLPLKICFGQQARQVAIAVVILTKQNERVRPTWIVIVHNSQVGAYYGLHSGNDCLGIELHERKKIVLIG